jgi:chromate transporter
MSAARREVAAVFLRLGFTAFGGPAAHVALMERELVGRRGWLGRQAFLDYYAATQLIPGPNSTELAIHLGRERAGWAGFWIAGACFILPAALLVGAIAAAYLRFGTLPDVAAALRGIYPVVIAIVVQALVGLGRTAVRTRGLAALALASAGAALVADELLVLAAAAVVSAGAWRLFGARGGGPASAAPVRAPGSTPSSVALEEPSQGGDRDPGGRRPASEAGGPDPTGAPGADPPSIERPGRARRDRRGFGVALIPAAAAWPAAGGATLLTLFATFLKIGSVLFGSGYVLLAFLRADFVERLGWLTERQLLDAVAVGQFTPGPVFTTATFIGMLVGGVPGAALATIAIFLPAFAFVALTSPWIPRLRRWPLAAAVLDGLNVASLALMAVVTWRLARTALVDPATWAIAALAAVALIAFRVGSAWLIAAGGVLGVLLARVG